LQTHGTAAEIMVPACYVLHNLCKEEENVAALLARAVDCVVVVFS
jgi:hypothetical protein